MVYMKTTTYSAARERLASLIEDVIATRETALITRRGFEPVAIIPAEELVGLLETAHLLRSPLESSSAILPRRRGQGNDPR